ncbi:hypothetical protein [Aggregatibacter kilianii]|uniref:hypothetical protein n=1 Tax=Aggregatibacter kilianii TaxID=2025884 RepID=UPI00195502F8|nr:hypothetical protein [Aggregatibacter kilianii]
MPKYIARLYCMVEVTVEAENIEEVNTLIDLNEVNVDEFPHVITEIDDVVEIEEL